MNTMRSLIGLAAIALCCGLGVAQPERAMRADGRLRLHQEVAGPDMLQLQTILPMVPGWALTAGTGPAVPSMVLAFRSDRVSHVFAVDDIYLYDTGSQSCFTLQNAGNPKPANNVDISADARYVAWDNGKNVLLYDRVLEQLVPLPNCEAGVWPTLSQHAEYIAFIGGQTCADAHMALYDRVHAKMVSLPNFPNPTLAGWPCLDPSGQYIAFQTHTSPTGQRDVGLYDRQAGAVVPLPGLNSPSKEDLWPQLDYGAQTISFWREGSGNGVYPPVPGQIMVYLRGPHTFAPTKLLSLKPNQYAWGYEHSMSSNGRYLLVSYTENNPAAQPPNHMHPDLYVYDRQTDQLLPLANLNTVWWEWKPSISG